MNEPTYVTSACSEAYAELINLLYAAEFHKKHCDELQCNVALYSLRKTGKRLLAYVWPQEKAAAIGLWEKFPIA